MANNSKAKGTSIMLVLGAVVVVFLAVIIIAFLYTLTKVTDFFAAIARMSFPPEDK
jgi:flagellar basal body-associated protein FliL